MKFQISISVLFTLIYVHPDYYGHGQYTTIIIIKAEKWFGKD